MNLIKSPVCFKREELVDWLNKTFPELSEGIEIVIPKQYYACVLVVAVDKSKKILDSSVVYYHEFQTARYQVVPPDEYSRRPDDEAESPEGIPINQITGYGR